MQNVVYFRFNPPTEINLDEEENANLADAYIQSERVNIKLQECVVAMTDSAGRAVSHESH
jgi:hypothetical protein